MHRTDRPKDPTAPTNCCENWTGKKRTSTNSSSKTRRGRRCPCSSCSCDWKKRDGIEHGEKAAWNEGNEENPKNAEADGPGRRPIQEKKGKGPGPGPEIGRDTDTERAISIDTEKEKEATAGGGCLQSRTEDIHTNTWTRDGHPNEKKKGKNLKKTEKSTGTNHTQGLIFWIKTYINKCRCDSKH